MELLNTDHHWQSVEAKAIAEEQENTNWPLLVAAPPLVYTFQTAKLATAPTSSVELGLIRNVNRPIILSILVLPQIFIDHVVLGLYFTQFTVIV